MKKTLFLSAILGAALCSTAFAEDYTYTGTSNSNIQLNDKTADDTITFKMGDTGTANWFGSAQATAAKILIEDDASTEAVEGLNITNGNQSYVTFSGAVSGNGALKKTGAGTNLNLNFTGDVTEYTGNITFAANNAFVLRFGSTSNDASAAGTAPTTSATNGVSGTGIITFNNNGNSTLVYNYAASESPVYITNEIQRSNNGQVKVELRGGASYVLTKNVVAFNSFTLADNSSMKYMGSTQISIGGQVASGSTLEGVITNNASNVKYTGTYGVDSGTLKNVQVHQFDAGANEGSITLNGVYGNIKNGGTQRNITLTGDGLRLTEGYTGGSYTFQKLDGSGNLEKRFSGNNETFTFQNATGWTGTFVNMGGSANVIFNGNSNADIDAKGDTNVTLKGTNYSDMLIKAYNNKTATVTVSNSADTTLKQFIQDPWGETHGHAKLVLDNGHKTTITDWATVDSVTMKNGSSVKLTNHTIGTLKMESGSGTVDSGAAIGSAQHTITNIELGNSATLKLLKAATVQTVTGAENSDLLVTGNLTVTGDAVIPNLTVTEDATLMLNNHLVNQLTIEAGKNVNFFSNKGIGSDTDHLTSMVTVGAGAALTFGSAKTTVGSISLCGGSTVTVGDQGSHDYTLTTSGLSVLGSGNGINADLVVTAGSTMTFGQNSVLTMGCDVTIGSEGGDAVKVYISCTEAEIAGILSGDEKILINNLTEADTVTLGNAQIYVNGALNEKFHLALSEDRSAVVVVVPEPATATLSLLALAALASRRRRK